MRLPHYRPGELMNQFMTNYVEAFPRASAVRLHTHTFEPGQGPGSLRLNTRPRTCNNHPITSECMHYCDLATILKQVEQEAAYPILYIFVQREAYIAIPIAFLMPVTVVRYRDGVCNGVCSLLSHLFFIIYKHNIA